METLKRQSNHKKFNILWYYVHLNWCQLFNFTFWSMVFDPILLVYALSIKCYTLARKNRSLELWNINKHIKNEKNMKKNGKMEKWKYENMKIYQRSGITPSARQFFYLFFMQHLLLIIALDSLSTPFSYMIFSFFFSLSKTHALFSSLYPKQSI